MNSISWASIFNDYWRRSNPNLFQLHSRRWGYFAPGLSIKFHVRKVLHLQKIISCNCGYLTLNPIVFFMLEQLLKLVEQNAEQQIVQNKAIPDQFNNAAIKEVTNQIFNNLKGQVAGGNMQQIVFMFQNERNRAVNTNPVVSTMISSVSTSLNSKFGISSEVAESVAASLVPQVMSQIIRKANDPHDIDFDLQQMMRGMTGNTSLDISTMIGQQQKSGIGNIGNIFGKLFGK